MTRGFFVELVETSLGCAESYERYHNDILDYLELGMDAAAIARARETVKMMELGVRYLTGAIEKYEAELPAGAEAVAA